MKKWLTHTIGLIIFVAISLIATLYLRYGDGKPYTDLSGTPTLAEGTIEQVVVSPRPMGNAAVSAKGRIFYTIHPESNPLYPKLYEWVNGQPVAWPANADQSKLFETPLGLRIDSQNRLWIIDPGNHGTGQPKLVALDVETGKEVHRFNFPSDVAPLGSFLQDIAVSPDSRWIYIADVGFWAKRPGIVVYDSEKRVVHRVLNKHESVYPQNLLIRNPIRSMSYFGGILEMKTGVDGIAASRDGKWVTYAAMNHDTAYRIPAATLQDAKLSEKAVATQVQAIGKKPLNDGITMDDDGNIFLTDVEHSAIMKLAPDGKLTTLIKDKRIRWADGLGFGPDGWLYLADSAIPEIVLQSWEHHESKAPYIIWRFKPGTSAAAGQ
jgi:hypothetical protein